MGQTLEGCEAEGKRSGPWSLFFNNFFVAQSHQVATVSMEALLAPENFEVYANLYDNIRQKLKISKTKFSYRVST